MPEGRETGWLDADRGEEEEDSYGHDSEGEATSRGVAFETHSSKRRKLNRNINDRHQSIPSGDEKQDMNEEDQNDGNLSRPDLAASRKSQKPSALTARKLEAGRNAAKKTGVIYLTRVPPFMKPATVRHLLQAYGEIGRIFLTPEDSTLHTRRVKAGGNKKRTFVDGWVEFLSKKEAKIAAETLNATIIGGKKGGWYHDDVWNMKYLKGFKWHHLTEQIANENAERAARLRAEIAQTTRENKAFLQNVERAKMLAGMEAKKNRKREGLESEAVEDDMDTSDPPRAGSAKFGRRDVKQNRVMLKRIGDDPRDEQPEDVRRVLAKIF